MFLPTKLAYRVHISETRLDIARISKVFVNVTLVPGPLVRNPPAILSAFNTKSSDSAKLFRNGGAVQGRHLDHSAWIRAKWRIELKGCHWEDFVIDSHRRLISWLIQYHGSNPSLIMAPANSGAPHQF